MSISDRDSMSLPSGLPVTVAALVVVATWWFGWREPLLHADTGAEPAGDTPFILAHVVASLLFGFLLPRHAQWAGPVVLAAAVLWIAVHVATYDGSEGASFWPVALLMILISMPVLSLVALLGRSVRDRIDGRGGGRSVRRHDAAEPG